MQKTSRRTWYGVRPGPQSTSCSLRGQRAELTPQSSRLLPHIEFSFLYLPLSVLTEHPCRVHDEAKLCDTCFPICAGYFSACRTGRTNIERISRAACRATIVDVHAIVWRMYFSRTHHPQCGSYHTLMLTFLSSAVALRKPLQPHLACRRILPAPAAMRRFKPAYNYVWRKAAP